MSHEIRSEPTPCARPGRHAHRPLCPLGRRCTGCRFALPPWRNLCCWMAARHPHASRGERCALCSGPISTACPPPPTPAAQPHGLRCEQRLVDGRVIHSRVDGLLPHALVRIILLRGRCGRGLVRRSLLRIRRLLPELSWAVLSWAVPSCRGLSWALAGRGGWWAVVRVAGGRAAWRHGAESGRREGGAYATDLAVARARVRRRHVHLDVGHLHGTSSKRVNGGRWRVVRGARGLRWRAECGGATWRRHGGGGAAVCAPASSFSCVRRLWSSISPECRAG